MLSQQKFLLPLDASLSSTPGLIARRIREAITTGELRPGDRLPAEAEMATKLNVAPMTIRSALAALRDLGLVTTIRGRNGGNFIADNAEQHLVEAIEKSVHTLPQLRNLTDWRRAVSGEAALLAAERRTELQLNGITAAAADFEKTLKMFPELRFADARLHALIAEASGSDHLMKAEAEIQIELTQIICSANRPMGNRRLASFDHGEIIGAIADRDGTAARAAMIRHVEDTFSWLSMAF